MVRRALLLALLALGAGALAAPAGAATPVRYDGRARGGAPVVLRLTGTSAAYDVGVRGRCTDGRSFVSGLAGKGAEIDADGVFSADARRPGRYGGRAGTYVLSLGARRRGDRVTGTVRVRFTARGLVCDSGRAPFRAFRDGSPGAPFRDGRTATGRYTGGGGGIRVLVVRVFLPAREVTRLSFSWRVPCRARGVFLTGGEDFVRLGIGAGRFRDAGHARRALGGGAVSHDRYALAGRFFREGRGYRVRGTWRLRSVVRRGGRVVARCATPGLAFTGRYRGR